MTKYLTEEKFLVASNNKEAIRNYADNYDRIFGDEPDVDSCDRCGSGGPFVGIRVEGKPQWCLKCENEMFRSAQPAARVCDGVYDDGIADGNPTRCSGREGCGLPGCPACDFGVTVR